MQKGGIQHLTSHNPHPESTSEPIPDSGDDHTTLPSFTLCHNDLNQPIAHKKGVRSCTQHPLSNFVSYHSLSPTFRAFSVALAAVVIPRSVPEAL